MSQAPSPPRLLTPAQVGAMFGVNAKTVTRWAKRGKLSAIRTIGGHRRYDEAEVLAFANAWTGPRGEKATP